MGVKGQFDVVALAADVVIFTVHNEKIKVLLIEMKKKPYADHWAIPGGMVDLDESVDEAAERHLQDKTGLNDVHLEQLYTFGDVDRDPFGRVVATAYMALVPSDKTPLKTTEDYAGIGWFSVDRLPKLAYDHKKIITLAVERLRSKLTYTNIVYSLLPKYFTMSELQEIYEIILGRALDKRNFRRKMRSLGVIKKTRKKRTGKAHRPAALYTFKKHTPQVVDML